jgi:hypothetical protein
MERAVTFDENEAVLGLLMLHISPNENTETDSSDATGKDLEFNPLTAMTSFGIKLFHVLNTTINIRDIF